MADPEPEAGAQLPEPDTAATQATAEGPPVHDLLPDPEVPTDAAGMGAMDIPPTRPSAADPAPLVVSQNLQSTRVGKYELLEVIGRGAMGTVYLAHDTALERDVAVKLMVTESASDPDLGERFVREARAAARLTHPNVVQVFDLGAEADGTRFIAMELLKGDDLLHTLRHGPPLALERKLDLVLQSLAGLGQAHQAGIVHRDIKPANIFVCQDGVAKIMDFGVARLVNAQATSTGLVVGTADYMSPEQVKAAAVDARSDLFSVGCVLFEMLTRHRPFHADDIVSTFYMITHEEPDYDLVPAGAEFDSLIPVLKKALAKDPAERYASADHFAADLRRCLEELKPAATPAAPVDRRRHARMNIDLPVKIEGWEADGTSWSELSTTEDASLGGGGFRLKHAVEPGHALRLQLSLPRQFRQYDHDEVTYAVWGLVRSAREGRVGVLFLGREPPAGWSAQKGGTFTLPADRLSARQHPRFEVTLNLRLLRPEGRAGRQEEWTVTENIGQGGAQVRTGLRIRRGETIELEEVAGDFYARAEVQSVSHGADNVTRLNVQFVGDDVADRVREVLKRNGIAIGDEGPSPDNAPRRSPLLLLESDPAQARALRRMIERTREPGWAVEVAPSLAAAVARLGQPGLEAILVDVEASDSSGLATLERVHAAAPSLPVVVLIGADQEELGIESLRRGAQDYMVRSQVDEGQLARVLRSSVARKKASLAMDPAPYRPPAKAGQPLEPGAFPGILREHYVGRKTGVITVVKGDAARMLRLREGSIVAASSGVAGERFGDTLVRLQLLSAEDAARATEVALRDRQRLGAVVTSLGLLADDRLQEALATHVRDVFAAIVGLEGASWSFREEPIPEHEDVTLHVPTGEILLESVRRMSDPELVRRLLGNIDRPLGRTADPMLGFQRVGLSPTEGYVLSRVDGSLTARQVMEVVPLAAEDSEKILLGLLSASLVEWTARAPKPARKDPTLPPQPAPVFAPPAAAPPPPSPPAPTPLPARPHPTAAQSAAAAPEKRPAMVFTRVPSPTPKPAPAPVGPAKPPAAAPAAAPARPPSVRRQEILDTYESLQTKDHFAVLGLTPAATTSEVRDAYQRMARSFHPDAHHDPALADLKEKIVAVFIRVGEINGILSDQHRRGAYEFELNRKAEATRRDDARRAAASAPPPPDPVLLLKKAQAFLAAGKAGDAVHLLEEAVPLTRGRMKTRARVILAQAYLTNPKWTHDAQEALERALQEDPEHLETYPLLGALYAKAGLKARAAGIYRRGLALKADWPELAAALASVTSG